MKGFRFIFLGAALALAASCTPKVRVTGTLTDAPHTRLLVKQLTTTARDIVDTIETGADGSFAWKLAVEERQPEFVYLYVGDTRIASLLLQKGDRVRIVADTLGNYTVEGSPESLKLQQVEKEFSDFMKRFTLAADAGDREALSRQYIAYYRSRVKYVMEHPKSLTAIPVLYQQINENFPVFSQGTDAIHFRNVHDSLMTVFPDSRYVKALGREAERRDQQLRMSLKIHDAAEMSYPDLELPSVDGSKVRLGEVAAKVVMVYFWSAADASQKMFNQDVLVPVYGQYHPKGFEIYSVSLDTDKGVWASAVKSQNLPWINVCDGMGSASRAAVQYNIRTLPASFMIVDGVLTDASVHGEASLRKFLKARLP